MAKMITSLTFCAERMTAGERRLAQRLEDFLDDNCLIWYDIPLGQRYRHPDFVIIDPSQGVIFLEVKDWRLSTLRHADPQTVILETKEGTRHELNPLEQVRQYACSTINMLSKDSRLQQKGKYHGKLNVAWAYGVVLTNITREQLKSLSAEGVAELIFPPNLTICQDEMTESTSSHNFRKKISGLFTTRFRPPITPEMRDILRQHLFPEMIIPSRKPEMGLLKVMDMQQEILARNIGEGHRVIHGVAGSGKTLILLYRCMYLAETLDRPILVLCYNITLANYLRECIEEKGLKQKVHVYHFHGWCAAAVRKFKVFVSPEGKYCDNSFDSLEEAVRKNEITDTGYDAVLIDEGHDFDSRWLTLIARLFDNNARSLLLMYDDAQSLYRRKRALNFSLASVGVQAQGRTSILRINYRNTKSILSFAYAFSRDYFATHRNQEIPQVYPEACGEEGEAPQILHCVSESDEATTVAGWLVQKKALNGRWGDIAILCPTKHFMHKIREALEQRAIPYAACFERAEKRGYSHREDVVHLLTFQSSKGLEFPFVAVANASFVSKAVQDESDVIPALYVAFTRATRELLVTCYRKNSISLHLEHFAQMDLQELQHPNQS